jgi:hypothetical protein
MQRKKYRYVRLNDNIEIPVPAGCTKEEEQEFITKFKAEHNLVELENDYRLLARQIGGDNLTPEEATYPLEELIRELQEAQRQFDQRIA